MEIKQLFSWLDQLGVGFYTGVPDSILQPFCQHLLDTPAHAARHIVAANEGAAIGHAAGFHLATGGIPCVYMQNSGLGNAFNPISSLLHQQVYAMPALLLIGWRGEPAAHDEPQHMVQGRITIPTLELLGIPHTQLSRDMTLAELQEQTPAIATVLAAGGQYALVVRRGALPPIQPATRVSLPPAIRREAAIEKIVACAQEDVIIGTTGKTSRELFEIRDRQGSSHAHDFLTVGSMGHASAIAMGVALHTSRRVWCLDGDGAALMHLGTMAAIGRAGPPNLLHVVFNNGAHESVGGMPTTHPTLRYAALARDCGYPTVRMVTTMDALEHVLREASTLALPALIEIQTAIGSRKDLG